jgi:hypothetical protein
MISEERVRKIDVEKLSEEQLENVMAGMSEIILNELKASEERLNKVLNIYGIKGSLYLDITQVVK